jgi:hypothetical protein
MVQLSPETQIRPFKQSYKWASGYRYEDTTILGFSHTHFSGSGHSDLGDVLLQPISGDAQLEPGGIEKPGSGYRSRFSHKQERAEPCYYAVVTLHSNRGKRFVRSEKLHLNGFFRTFGAASNKKLRPNSMPVNNLDSLQQKPKG